MLLQTKLRKYCDSKDYKSLEVDCPMFVSPNGIKWFRRHFASFKNGRVYVFNNGRTSFSTCHPSESIAVYEYALTIEDFEEWVRRT